MLSVLIVLDFLSYSCKFWFCTSTRSSKIKWIAIKLLELHKYSKQYKKVADFFACNIITCMCIFSNKLYLILSIILSNQKTQW